MEIQARNTPNGVISTKTNVIAGHFGKRICSQLETLGKVGYNFFLNLFTLMIFIKVDKISSHC